MAAAAALAVVLSAGCGGDDGDEIGGDAGQPSITAGDESPDSGGDGGDDGEDGEEGAGFDCPLSAEQVSEVLGATVEKDDATCTYLPGGNTGSTPGAGFIPQLAELCEDDFPSQTGYDEPVDGLGVDAFLKTGGGATAEIWVCSPSSFVVFVDTGNSDTATATAAAEELAKAALDAG